MAQLGILRLYKLTQSLLDFVKQDYEYNVNNIIDENLVTEHNTVEESFLYRCIASDDAIEGISYRTLAEEMFTRDSMNSRKVTVELMFSRDKAMLPQIAIREPAKGKGQTDAIGGIGDEYFVNEDGSFQEEKRKSYTSQYELLVTSPNRHEVIIMEEVLLGLLIGAQDTLALANPFYNFNFSVKELMVNNEMYAETLFVKSIGINVSYDKSYPNLIDNSILTKILFEHQILTQ